jgi:DNA uptake protein ComE-like DNA-binding protein
MLSPAAITVVLTILFAAPVIARADGVLDANTASAEQLAEVPGMNQSLAAKIIAARPFATIGALDELLSGELGDDQREVLYGALFVRVKLNSAARSDILLIPGVGQRMAHEFEEYRPYSSIEQFRREIGKYVDAAEVARLEQYVMLD